MSIELVRSSTGYMCAYGTCALYYLNGTYIHTIEEFGCLRGVRYGWIMTRC